MRTWLWGLVLALAPARAYADQCVVVDEETAAAAAKLLDGATVMAYCERCGDTAPSKPRAKPAVTIATDPDIKAGGKRVRLDGKDADLAYTYVKTGNTTYTNVGLMVGCGAVDVKAFITPDTRAPKPPPPARPGACDPFSHMHDCRPGH